MAVVPTKKPAPAEGLWRGGRASSRPGSDAAAASKFMLRGRCSVCIDAGTLRDLTIRDSEAFYPDRGMLEVDPLSDVPRPNLPFVQQLVQPGREPSNTEDTAHDWKCDHAVIRGHHVDPFTRTGGDAFVPR